MTVKERFLEMAEYCEDTFGCYAVMEDTDEEDAHFTCPECDEPLLFIDYADSDIWEECCEDFGYSPYAHPAWNFCPVCGVIFKEIED